MHCQYQRNETMFKEIDLSGKWIPVRHGKHWITWKVGTGEYYRDTEDKHLILFPKKRYARSWLVN